MSGYTLISCIGTGMYKKEGGYRQTVYQFPDNGPQYETSLFLRAILETEYRPIKKVILVGTYTSGWDMLIPNPDNEEHLWGKILEECGNKKQGISEESIKELESKLPGWYNNIPFKISIHSNELNQKNVESIFSTYVKIADSLEPNTDILFDISHGFRSMPILMFQSLQLNASKIFGKKVELIYGEYIEEEKISHVRDLSKYWDYFETSSAIKLFDEKYDGKLLAEKIKLEGWESGAEFLFNFSEIVEFNFSLQIIKALKKLKKALAEYDKTEKPEWLTDVWSKLENIYNKLSLVNCEKYPIAKTMWEYSKLLRDKKLTTQAVIALWVTVETAITEKLEPSDPSKIGNYKWFNERSIKQFNNIRKRNRPLYNGLNKIKEQRNRIAHGGGKDNNGHYPNQENMKKVIETMDHVIEELFKTLG